MKMRLTQLSTLIGLCLTTLNARAVVVLQDSMMNYPDGPLTTSAGGTWGPAVGNTNSSGILATNGTVFIPAISPTDQPRTFFTTNCNCADGVLAAPNYITNGTLFHGPFFTNAIGYFASNSPTTALYSRLDVNLPVPRIGNGYFAYFVDTNFNFRA